MASQTKNNAKPSLQSQILASDAFRSFLSEKSVCRTLNTCGWTTQHGAYFEDLETKKPREVDVVARQRWRRGQKKAPDQLALVSLLIEVKTMAGFHLVASPFDVHDTRVFHQNTDWLGDFTGEYADLCADLLKNGWTAQEVRAFKKSINRYAFPGDFMRLADLSVRPPSETAFTSFRETNIGKEKELDQSVFWRASRSLRSACQSIREGMQKSSLAEIAESGRKQGEALPAKKKIDFVTFFAKMHLDRIHILHPIVVTDAKLWVARASKPVQAKWLRFAPHDFAGSPEWWCDVVDSSHFPEYTKRLSNHYARELVDAGAVRDRNKDA